ncbi:MAG TPA: transglycosylase family protein [Actinomycetota bacterium]|nr:transglycosylase family protein [Actinomycetota bacterium]
MHERLRFGERARRRARRGRRKQIAAAAWVAAVAVGIPGADAGLSALRRVTGEERPAAVVAGGYEATESATSALKFRRKVFALRPTPTPSARKKKAPAAPTGAPAPAPAGSITGMIAAAATEFGLSADYLISVANCESSLNPNAANPAGYHGLFQFDQSTWAAYGYGSIYDPVAQARTAARLIAAGQASRWPNCA